MFSRPPYPCSRARNPGFTLIEVLLALAISAVVLAAVGGVFYSAIRLRDHTVAALEPVARLHPVLVMLRRDLQNAVWPGGIMTGVFRCGPLGPQFNDALGLQFSTTTAKLDESEPFGEIQEVAYELREGGLGRRGARELVRSINRNPLATLTTTPTQTLLLEDVESFEVTCFDGSQWQTVWDTSSTQTNLPLSVRVQIELADDPDQQIPTPAEARTYEILVPLVVYAPTNASVNSAEGGGGL